MENIQILIIGKHPDIMKTILRLLNNRAGWTGHGAFTVDEAIEKSQTMLFNLVLLGAGLSELESRQVQAYFTAVPVVQHYGGGSGLLYAEVYQALSA